MNRKFQSLGVVAVVVGLSAGATACRSISAASKAITKKTGVPVNVLSSDDDRCVKEQLNDVISDYNDYKRSERDAVAAALRVYKSITVHPTRSVGQRVGQIVSLELVGPVCRWEFDGIHSATDTRNRGNDVVIGHVPVGHNGSISIGITDTRNREYPGAIRCNSISGDVTQVRCERYECREEVISRKHIGDTTRYEGEAYARTQIRKSEILEVEAQSTLDRTEEVTYTTREPRAFEGIRSLNDPFLTVLTSRSHQNHELNCGSSAKLAEMIAR